MKNYPEGKSFVYDNSVKLTVPNVNAERKKLLEENLLRYLDDSLTVRKRSILGFTQRLNPPVFDSANLATSLRFMDGYLQTEGYYRSIFDTVVVKYDTVQKRGKPQYRVENTFFVTAGKMLRIDTVAYNFDDSLLQQEALSIKANAELHEGGIYTESAVGRDLDRLSSHFRNKGFFRISKNVLLAEIDTTDQSLVNFDLDPVEQQLIAQRRIDSPTVRIKIMQRPAVDNSYFQQYTIDSVIIYPETNIRDNVDSLLRDSGFRQSVGPQQVIIREKENQFQQKMLRRTNYLMPGSLYNEQTYFRTLNGYTQMGPWQQVDVRTFRHYDSDSAKVSFHLFLFPAKRQTLQFDLEGSQNNNVSGSLLTSQFFALSLLGTHRHHNVFKKGSQSTTTARVGFELNNARNTSINPGIFQTFVTGITQTFSLPRLLFPFSYINSRKLDAVRTNINGGFFYADRFQFYRQQSYNANIAWEIRKGLNTFSFSAPVFESVQVQASDSLTKLIRQNPSILFSFNPGHMLGFRGRYERGLLYNNSKYHSGLYRFGYEVGLPWNFNIGGNPFYQFIKLETQLTHQLRFYKSSLHGRILAGSGWNTAPPDDNLLPFFKQFVAGGNSSMRAWSLRQLGPGNSLIADTSSIYTDRFSDVVGEFNLEYRYRITRLLGFELNGAVFTDIGNIWSHKPYRDGLGDFQWKNLYRDLAMGVGTGVRWDLTYLVIRLDAAYKVKDPVREGNGWMKEFAWKGTNRLGTRERNNYAIQFGIGYPF